MICLKQDCKGKLTDIRPWKFKLLGNKSLLTDNRVLSVDTLFICNDCKNPLAYSKIFNKGNFKEQKQKATNYIKRNFIGLIENKNN